MTQEKLLELYFNKINTQPTLTLVARHEAAHAIMRHLVELPPTRIEARHDSGLCDRSGGPCDARQEILVLLAGIAHDAKYSAWLLDLRNSRTADLEQTRTLLAQKTESRRAEIRRKICTVGVEKALRLAMERACDILEPLNSEIEALGGMLAKGGRLSATKTGAFMRRHIDPIHRLDARQWKQPLGRPIRQAMLAE
jgi:hypothetical protein